MFDAIKDALRYFSLYDPSILVTLGKQNKSLKNYLSRANPASSEAEPDYSSIVVQGVFETYQEEGDSNLYCRLNDAAMEAVDN